MFANTILYFLVPGVIDEIEKGEIVGMQTSAGLILGMDNSILLDSTDHGSALYDIEG